MKVVDIATAVNKDCKHEIVGIRPGEKLHEQMIGPEDSIYTFEYDSYFKILPSINDWSLDKKRIGNGKKVAEDFIYSSDNNSHWLTIPELQDWIRINHDKIGSF